MEGTPVREPERPDGAVALHQAEDLLTLQRELTGLIKEELHDADVFVSFSDASSRKLELPAWVESHLQVHPALLTKLQHGEMVGMSHARSSVVLIPILFQANLYGTVGIISPLEGPQLSNEAVERVGQMAYFASPFLARLLDNDRLGRRNRELTALYQMRTHLQYNVAHELRTPMAAIRGYARMLIDARAGDINNTQRDYLKVITENTNRLIQLVSWMSHVAEMSSQHLKITSFDFRDLWSECLRSWEEVIKEKQIKTTEHIAEEPFRLVGDREKLLHALTSLMSVAVRFIDEKGTIVAEFSHGRDRETLVKITNSGQGIPTEALNKLLERHYASSSIPPGQKSDVTDAGLTDLYDIVGMHGGRVFVNSRAGEGTTFQFTLPAVTFDGEGVRYEQAINSSRR